MFMFCTVSRETNMHLYLFSSTPCILHTLILGQMFIGNMPTWHASAYRRSERRQMASMVIIRVSGDRISGCVLYPLFYVYFLVSYFPLFQVMT
ncbi:hypothetical protein BJX66DRAFT_152512 [Aspergillus keveii]|uniref:Uncharacterized protein n=1 Tax=Aspergillus keveii TaxID=714993 RepID=A0ABR4GAB5_9EURO